MLQHRDVIAEVEKSPEGLQTGALFDFDGTVIYGYSAVAFIREQVKRGDLSPRELMELAAAMTSFGMGNIGFSAMMVATSQFMRGVSEESYIEFGGDLYQKHLARLIYPESRALIGLSLDVDGEEYLWSDRPCVFIFNHQSKADVIIAARLLRRDIAGIGKKEIKKMPVIGQVMEFGGVVLIDRANAANVIEAMQAGVPIVPIVIHNALDVAPKGISYFGRRQSRLLCCHRWIPVIGAWKPSTIMWRRCAVCSWTHSASRRANGRPPRGRPPSLSLRRPALDESLADHELEHSIHTRCLPPG